MHKTIKPVNLAFLISSLSSVAGIQNTLANEVSVSGAVEVEFTSNKDFTNTKSSDIALATVELTFESQINNRVSAQIVLLHEEDDTPLEVDVGTISMDLGSGFSMTAGQTYLPFGSYQTHMISDTLSLELTETRQSVILFDYENNALNASFYVFNGDVLKTSGSDKMSSAGLNIAYSSEQLTTGLSYCNNLMDNGGISSVVLGSLAPTPTVTDYVAGTSVYLTTGFDKTSIMFEYTTMNDDFDVTEVGVGTSGAKPTAMNVEAGFDLADAVVAVAYQSTGEAVNLGLPETRLLLS